MVVREPREVVDRMPARVRRDLRVDAGGDKAEIRRRELPPRGVPFGLAQRLELLEVRELADVDLLRQVPPRRLLERLGRC